MGRKEGGSLFHQLIHAPGVMTLSDRKSTDGSEMDVSFKTRENYHAWLHKAADYFKGQGIRSVAQICLDEVQAYADMLLDKGLSASTIHSYLSPVCKATGVELKEIEKPIRHASEFTRSSGGGKKHGGRPGELNELVGIRENELRHLRGKNRELGEKQGKPIELDRLALRAVSVLHLAHWRDKVTVQSYFFAR